MVLGAKKWNILFPNFSFQFFWISFVYFASLEAAIPGNLKQKYCTRYLYCIFQNFLCIFCKSRGSTSRPPRTLKFLVLLSIPHRNGISFSANSFLKINYFWTPLVLACCIIEKENISLVCIPPFACMLLTIRGVQK